MIPLAGATARRIQRVKAGGRPAVLKYAPPPEVAALQAVQALLPEATALPELMETGRDAEGQWHILPEYGGTPSTDLTENALDSLALLHARFRGRSAEHREIPIIDLRWWQGLCTDWVRPGIEQHAAQHGAAMEHTAQRLVDRCLIGSRVAELLRAITPTLLHGDIHSGNVLTEGDRTHLIDWGSARFGTPMLDLVNLLDSASPQFYAYLDRYAEYATHPMTDDEVHAGIRWSALQIPVQYLPWTLENLSTPQAELALEVIDQALGDLG